MKNIVEFQQMKDAGRPISMLTCYDHWTAQILNHTDIDCLLVGDSAGMVMQGYKNTIPTKIELIAGCTRAVTQGAPDKLVIADLPFLSTRKGLRSTMEDVALLMEAGAQALKIESMVNTSAHAKMIRYIVESGVPVIGHLGLTAQAIHQLGGFRVQNKGDEGLKRLLRDAEILEEAGCFSVLLECVPASAAAAVSERLTVPTIGIGAGPHTHGQVLVLQDMLGMQPTFKPKFLKTFLNGYQLITEAVNGFDREVKAKIFPSEEQTYL